MPTFEWDFEKEKAHDSAVQKLIEQLSESSKEITTFREYNIMLGSSARLILVIVTDDSGQIPLQISPTKTKLIVWGSMPSILRELIIDPEHKKEMHRILLNQLKLDMKREDVFLKCGFLKGRWEVTLNPGPKLISQDIAFLKASVIRRTVNFWKKNTVKTRFGIKGNWTDSSLPRKK